MSPSKINNPNIISSEEIMKHVSTFTKSLTKVINIPQEEVIKIALILLKSMPSARQAVLDFFAGIYKEATADYFLRLGRNDSFGYIKENEEGLNDVHIYEIESVIIKLILDSPKAWSFFISSWSINLMSQMSSEYYKHRNLPIVSVSNSFDDQFLIWNNCNSSKSLIKILLKCFTCLFRDEQYICIDNLINICIKKTPQGDWLVAHIGLCFPDLIINCLLHLSLTEYYSSLSFPFHNTAANLNKSSKSLSHSSVNSIGQNRKEVSGLSWITSLIKIIDYLALQHLDVLRQTILIIIEKYMEEQIEDVYIIIPIYILYMSSQSVTFLNIISQHFIKKVNPAYLNRFCSKLLIRKIPGFCDYISSLNMIVKLLMDMDENAYELIQILINYGTEIYSCNENSMETDVANCDIKISTFCSSIMDHLVAKIQKLVNSNDENMNEIKILHSLKTFSDKICYQYLDATSKKNKWYLKILTSISILCGNNKASQILGILFINSTTNEHFLKFEKALQEIQQNHCSVITDFVNYIIIELYEKTDGSYRKKILVNLNSFSQKNDSQFSFKDQIWKCLFKLINKLNDLFSNLSPDLKQLLVSLLYSLGPPKAIELASLIKISIQLVNYFFSILVNLNENDLNEKNCIKVINYLACLCSCNHPIQTYIIRLFLEGALSEEYSYLFGSKSCLTDNHSIHGSNIFREISKNIYNNDFKINSNSSSKIRPPMANLFTENQNKNKSGTNSLVFHAGTIGFGLRGKSKSDQRTEDSNEIINNQQAEVCLNKHLLLYALWKCSLKLFYENTDNTNRLPSFSDQQIPQNITKLIASILVEQVTPDVLYNSSHWPDEEFIKVTVERDIVIKKRFLNQPILWDFLDFLTLGNIGIWHCSCLLRSLVAVFMSQWETSRENYAKDLPYQIIVTQKIIDLMRKGQLLPEPLCYTGELLPYLSPYEVYLLLLNIWRYMKELAPYPNQKLQTNCSSRYTDVMHSIIQKHIDKLGHLYPLFLTI